MSNLTASELRIGNILKVNGKRVGFGESNFEMKTRSLKANF